MSNNITLMTRVAELTVQHGSLRAAARALKVDPGYFYRLGTGVCNSPGELLLRRMGLKSVVTYERLSL